MPKRVTVRIEHKKKCFYERILSTMKMDQEDRKQKYVLSNALENLKRSPFEVENIVDLKNIQGIGESIAVKLVDAWEAACRICVSGTLSLKDVKTFTNDELRKCINSSSRKRVIPDQKTGSMKPGRTSPADEFIENDEKSGRKLSSTTKSTVNQKVVDWNSQSSLITNLQVQPIASQKDSNPSVSSSCFPYQIFTCNPIDQPRVILIADNREHHGNSRFKSVIDHLSVKENISVDIRPLSVGDYMWVCRKIDGSEIVMDWVVERKTLHDLQSSIRGGRYIEQKARLKMAPMKNRIYLIEASSKGDAACEQALASTLSNGGYLIQRCSNTSDTAIFLKELTTRLEAKASKEEISGIHFDQLQDLTQKKKSETVRDTWIRQLMICPGMSYSRAEAISDRFPSMPALMLFFQTSGDDAPIDLLHVLPQITRPIARNLYKFFVR